MIEIIRKRISRRQYKNMSLKENDADYIKNLINEINTESGLNFALVLDAKRAFNGITKSYGLFKDVNSVIILKGKNSEDFLELCGYYGEKLVLAATARNLGTCYVGGSFDRKFFEHDGEEIACVITIGYVNERLSAREKIIHSAIHSKNEKTIDNVNTDHTLTELKLLGIEAVKLAPAAKNRNVIKMNFIEKDIIISTADSYHFDMFDLGVAKYNFEAVTDIKFPLGNNARITT